MAGVAPGVVSGNHYQAFQDILPEEKRLVVINALHSKRLLYKGETGTQEVAILYYNNHYLPLKSVRVWFGRSYYCIDCEVGYQNKDAHVCKKDYTCRRCKGQRCPTLLKFTSTARHAMECLQIRNAMQITEPIAYVTKQ